jgi:triosephosphate isomerase
MTSPGHPRALIGTSWKMNLTPSEAIGWFRTVVPATASAVDRQLFVLPPFPALLAARAELTGSHIRWGAQDIHEADQGAHTGDVSGAMLADLGCTIAEIGHSERRRDHGETDERIGAKVAAALRWDLTPLVCVGEPRHTDRESAGRHVVRQLSGAFERLSSAELDRVVVAFEPVWAIGVGAAAAGVDHISAMHERIGTWLRDHGASDPRVIYGGSVDGANAPEILAAPGVDGLFIGRAALDPTVFTEIAFLPLASSQEVAT